MNKEESIDKIIEILKKGALKFHDDFDKNLRFYFIEEKKDDEIVIHFNIKYDRKLEYLIIFKKQKTMADYIPDLKGYNKLDLSINPYKNLKFTDESVILSNIYDLIKEIYVDEIACYQKFGIILRNPLDLKGIYNINIKYITD
ncbi:MAG: hypothetical protein J6A36_03855 [Clostridia bacterium]|nr:hypothetical protein [Clostridia bacterium]